MSTTQTRRRSPAAGTRADRARGGVRHAPATRP